MGKAKISKEEAENIVKRCSSIADFCRAVGWEPKGDNYKTFHKYVLEYGLDTSHFSGQKSNIGNKNNKAFEKSVKEYVKSKSVRSSTLLKKLINEGIKERRCECCKNTEWLGEEIPLEIHHKDGNHFNNDIGNILVLCPNCHAKTDTYRGRKNKKKNLYFCKQCGKEITKWSKSMLCQECSHKSQRKVERPSCEVLKSNLENNTVSAVAKMYGVSFQTIKKWAKKYGI